MTKFIFVTGGVVSSLGKGLTSASIGIDEPEDYWAFVERWKEGKMDWWLEAN